MGAVPKGAGPFHGHWVVDGWTVDARAIVGSRRRRLEDAWVVVESGRLGGRPVLAAAVMDGLGGMPRGQEAAWAAVEALPAALEAAGDVEGVLGLLNKAVCQVGGYTTASVAIFFRDELPGNGYLLTVGDSSAYLLEGRHARRLTVPDVEERHRLTDSLGMASATGHVQTLFVPPGWGLLLCTDGVDRVTPLTSLDDAVGEPDADVALDRLMAAVEERGSPDNATAVVMRRRTQV